MTHMTTHLYFLKECFPDDPGWVIKILIRQIEYFPGTKFSEYISKGIYFLKLHVKYDGLGYDREVSKYDDN